MQNYLDLLSHILTNGVKKADRTNTGTLSVFGPQLRFDLSEGFPLMTTKKLHTPSIVHELLWFLSGSTNVKYMRDNGVTIWDEWADADGELGPVYGFQWRRWGEKQNRHDLGGSYDFKNISYSTSPGIDQLKQLIDGIRKSPDSRRHIVSAWNVADLHKMKLPPCHMMFQCYVANGKLSLHMHQRSADYFLGVPFNIASYALLTHLLAQVTELRVGELVITFGDCHLYLNHLDQAREQLSRTPGSLPSLWINPAIKDIDSFKFEDIRFLNYEPQPSIKAPIAV